MRSSSYRPDIDGLRAIAVLAVVGFHGFPGLIEGGFIGVDIFFVISGYLISNNIFVEINQKSFTFLGFYSRRIKRIFPALILVLIVSIVVGYTVLLIQEYKQFSRYLISASIFTSNLSLLRDSGYFDASAESKPLLHLWSLGVEEQFYLIWPLFIWFIWKVWGRLHHAIFIITLLSLFCNFIQIDRNVAVDFYSPQTRFWELSIGAWLALYGLNHKKILGNISENFFSLAGSLFLAIGFLVIDKRDFYPGFWAIIPVVGTLLIIHAGSKAYINRTLLSNGLLVWLGRISYPLYLWHWPIITFFRIIKGQSLNTPEAMILIGLSLVLAHLTNKYWESPLRFGGYKLIVPILTFMMVAIGFFGVLTLYQGGFPNRKVVANNLLIENDRSNGLRGNLQECSAGDSKYVKCIRTSSSTTEFVVMGDSKAHALFPGLVKTADNSNWTYIGSLSGDHPLMPIISDHPIYRKFGVASTPAVRWVADAQGVKVVLFVMAIRHLFDLQSPVGAERDIASLPNSKNYILAKHALMSAINPIVQQGKIVIFVTDNPTLPYPEDCIFRKTSIHLLNEFLPSQNPKCILTIHQHLLLTKQYRELLYEIKSIYPEQVYVFDTLKYLCDESVGICTHFKNQKLLYAYTDHISNYAAEMLGREINSFLKTLPTSKNTK